ncbi:MAG: aldehyde dehydrogenase family protein, partial [Candidatus Paceibacterota bacterium]
MPKQEILRNYINGKWTHSDQKTYLDVKNPAFDEIISSVPLTSSSEVSNAIEDANRAFSDWRRTPVVKRIQYLFKFKELLEENLDDIAETITMESGKTFAESQGELRRAIENVEVACGAPILSQGYNSEDIANGIDEIMIRQPLGVTAIISPFNFPAM